MNILHTVEFYEPSVGGAQTVVKQISERLVEKGHCVTVATTKLPQRKKSIINGVKIEEFDIKGNSVKGMTGETGRYKDFLLHNTFDVIMNYAAQQWTTDLFFTVIHKVTAKKVFVPCGFSCLHNPSFAQYFKTMPDMLKTYEATVYASEHYQDVAFAKKNHVNNLVFIPNGADEREFLRAEVGNVREKLGIPHDHLLIVTIGSHTGQKGHKETIEIFKKAALPHSTLLIIANQTTTPCSRTCTIQALASAFNPLMRLKDQRILVRDLSRKETVAALKAATILLFCSNVECSPLVLFEATAAKTAFLTADVGNAKEIIRWTGGGEMLPTIHSHGLSRVKTEAAAKQLKEMLHDNNRLNALAATGFSAWKQTYTWDQITNQYEQLYTSLLN